MRTLHFTIGSLCILAAGLAGCGDDREPICEASTVQCVDQAIAMLALQSDKVSEGDVTNTEENGDWVSLVDATAGGVGMTQDNPYIYLKFTDDGLTKVGIDDETAFESMDWDIAAKRFIVRLNGGSSGPSCVGAALLDGMSYDSIADVPDGLTYKTDPFFDAQCEFVSDDIGLGTALTALDGWWEYPIGCVKMTETPAVIQLLDGRHVLLVIEAYYGSGQQTCNDTGEMGTDSANLSFRWKFLD